jgi:hypothetical protein
MPEPPTVESAVRRRRTKLLVWAVLALALAIVLGLPYAWWQGKKLAVQAELDAIVARGEPVTAEQLNEYYAKPPAAEDCTELWLEAMRRMVTAEEERRFDKVPIVGGAYTGPDPVPGGPWPDRALAEEFLRVNDEALQLAHRAAAKGGRARYPRDFSRGIIFPIDDIQSVRSLARLLCVESRVRAHQGDAAGAARSIRAILALADSLENEPTFVSQLVRYAILGMAVGEIKDYLGKLAFSDSDLASLQAALHDRYSIRSSVIGDRAQILIAIRTGGYDESYSNVRKWALGAAPSLERYLITMQHFVDATIFPYPDARNAIDNAQANVESSNAVWSQLSRDTMTTGIILEASARSIAQSRLTRIAIALEKRFRTQGEFSATLDELVPTELDVVLLDPFSELPFQYRRTANGYDLFSTANVNSAGEVDPTTGANPVLLIRRTNRPPTAPSDAPTPPPVSEAPTAAEQPE